MWAKWKDADAWKHGTGIGEGATLENEALPGELEHIIQDVEGVYLPSSRYRLGSPSDGCCLL